MLPEVICDTERHNLSIMIESLYDVGDKIIETSKFSNSDIKVLGSLIGGAEIYLKGELTEAQIEEYESLEDVVTLLQKAFA
jgi:hypothetical protein